MLCATSRPMSLRSLRVLLPLVGCAFALPLVHCDNPSPAVTQVPDGSTGPINEPDASVQPEGGVVVPDVQLQSDKLDLLLAIDNSGSMSIKAQLLSKSLGPMLRRLTNPNCLKSDGSVAGVSSAGACPDGSTIEFHLSRTFTLVSSRHRLALSVETCVRAA